MMKKRKKIWSILIAYILIMSFVSSYFTAVAADAPQLSIENRAVNVGDTFTVDVNLENATNVFGGNFTLQYDSEILEVKDYAYGDIVSNHTKNCNLNYQSAGNLIRFTFSGATALEEDGTLLTLTFVAKGEVGDVAEISFTAYKMYGNAGVAIAGNATDATVTISAKPKYYMSANSLEVEAGTEFTLYVKLMNSSTVYGGEFILQYDNDLLEALQPGYGSNLRNHTKTASITNYNGQKAVRMSYSGTTPVAQDGTILAIKFLAKAGVSGTATFGFATYDTYGSDGNSIDMTAEGGDLTIKQPTATSIDIGEDLVGYVGFDKFQLNATFFPEDAAEESVTWSSGDESIAIVSSEGVVSLTGVGSTRITATSENGLTDSIFVTGIEMQELILGLDMRTPYESESYYKFVPEEDGTYKFYADSYWGTYAEIYDSNHELVASQELSLFVDYEIVVALKKGETYTLCVGTREEASEDFYVYVKQLKGAPVSVDIYVDEIYGKVGWSNHVAAIISPEDCIVGEITWTSSNESVVTVDQNGSIYFVGPGAATVTITLENGLSDSVRVRVSEKIEIAVDDKIDKTITEEHTKIEFVFTPTESGSYQFYSTGKLDTYLYTYIDGESINVNGGAEGDNFSFVYDFIAGRTYTFDVSVYDVGEVSFVLEKAKVLSKVEIVNYPTQMQYYEGVNNFYRLDGLKLKLTLEDGTEGYWTYGLSGEGYLGYPIEIEQDDNEVNISCGSQTIQFCFELIENPVESIEVITKEMPELIENVDGWFEGDIFIYDLYGVYSIYDLEIQINYKDGTSTRGFVYEEVNGYYISETDNQYEVPFSLGSDNYITIEYAGKEVNVPITVIENPVERLELITAPSHVYIVGDNTYGYTYEDQYVLWPENYDGLSFKVYYKGGIEKVYTYEDIVEESYYLYIDGREFGTGWKDLEWVIGENVVVFHYMGKTMEYSVTVAENPILSIKVKKAPDIAEYEEGYIPIFNGMQIEITYDDSTTKVVEVTEKNIIFEAFWNDAYLYHHLYVDGYKMEISENWNDDTEQTYWEVSYLGMTASIDELSFVQSREIANIEVSGSYLTGEDVVVDVTYEEGSKEQLALDFVSVISTDDNTFMGYAKTKNGITYYYADADVNSNGELLGYELVVLGENVYISLEEEEPEQTTNANIVVSSVTGRKGNQVKVNISLENNPGIISMKLKVAYDSSVMTLVGIEDKGNLGITMHSNQFTNPYVLSWANDTALQDICFNGDVVTLIFDVAEEASEGECAVNVSYDYDNYDICNYEQEKVKFNVKNGVVQIVDVIIGDVNRDGNVNTLDRIALARYLANWEGYTSETIDMLAADINCDGNVNTLDRIALARHLANWEGYEELPYVN